MLTNRLNKAMANMGQKGGDGEAVDGLGSPATWRRKNDKESSLAVVKGGRTLTVTIEASMSPEDQLVLAQGLGGGGPARRLIVAFGRPVRRARRRSRRRVRPGTSLTRAEAVRSVRSL